MSTFGSISENRRIFRNISASMPFKSLLPKTKQKMSSKRGFEHRSDSENIAPVDPNIQVCDPPFSASISFSKISPAKVKTNLHKVEHSTSLVQGKFSDFPDPPVKVVVRIRPVIGLGIGDTLVNKISYDSLSVAERTHTFDSVLDSTSTQGDVYQLVGAPLVKDAMSGYNASILAYGQTGSGKSYTMWGPPSAMVDGPSVSGLQGIASRIFQNLFLEIQKEQGNPDGKQVNYQCRCSFLEVYDEKIGDLLDPTQRDLKMKDDTKNGFYVENLTEEYVTCYEDVTQILIKGLSHKKIGATRINSKSSRSHIMFSFTIESWCKDSSSKCFGSSKTSRISLIDLAGFEGNVLDDASKQQVKEGKYIKKSLSQLGRLVNILAEKGKFGKSEEVPYGSSCLTHLLRESFGGNAKLSIICSISPEKMSSSETISTLRFGLRVRLIKNEPVVNEITEDDVNDLSVRIQQLKEELISVKSSGVNNSLGSNNQYSGGNARESLNQLRLSLNRSLVLRCIDNDHEENLSFNEDDVKGLKLHIGNSIRNSQEEYSIEDSENGEIALLYSAEGCDTEFACEHYLSCSDQSDNEEFNSSETQTVFPDSNMTESVDESPENNFMVIGLPSRNSWSTVLEGPVMSESPKIKDCQRKSSVLPLNQLPIQDNVVRASKILDATRQSNQQENIRSSCRMFTDRNESLATSLTRGLEILDYNKRNSSIVSFSFEHLALKPRLSTEKAKVSVQTSHDCESSHQHPATFTCVKCQGTESNEADSVKSKDMEKDLLSALEREEVLNRICKDQAAQIEHLQKTLELCKCRGNDQIDIIVCHGSSNFSNLKHQMLQPINEDENEKGHPPPHNDIKLLTWNHEQSYEPEFINEKFEVKEIQDSSVISMRKSFTLEDRDLLLSEIEILKNKLQRQTDGPTRKSFDNVRSSLLSQSIQWRKSCALSQGNNNSGDEFEKERQKWMEMESEWISLTEDLRIEIESNRQRAEQMEMELKLEKKRTEELDDVLRRSVLNHATMVEHYAELQEKYNDIVVKHRAAMEGIDEVKRAASKAGAKGRHGSRFIKALTAELSSSRVERDRERALLMKENRSLKSQLKDTAEAVHAAGELLVRLREAEEAASAAEEKKTMVQEENENIRKQIEKLKRKHKMEMDTMKQYLAESRLPEAALRPLYRQESNTVHHDKSLQDDDQSWRAEFGAIYQEHY